MCVFFKGTCELKNFFKLFTSFPFWTCWVVTAACVLSVAAVCGLLAAVTPLVAENRPQARGRQQPQHAGRQLRLVGCPACRRRDLRRVSSLFRSTWNLPRPGTELVSPTLGGGFSPTVPLCIFFSKTSSSKAFNHCLNFFFFG